MDTVLAIRKWKDGGEQTVEQFKSLEKCLEFISKQPLSDEYEWFVGQY